MAEPADRTAPDARLLVEAVASLPWLAPSAGSLVAWCRAPSLPTWLTTLRYDPGAVLLLLRACPSEIDRFPARAIETLAPLEFASRLLAGPPRGWLEWNDPTAADVSRLSRSLAAISRSLVVRCGKGNPEQAWVAGLLAPLGWMAALAFAPRRVSACFNDQATASAQRHHLGVEAVALSRQLARTWMLPLWLSDVVGRLDLPFDRAVRLGSDPVLFAAVRLAIESARRQGIRSGLLPAEVDLTAEQRLLGPVSELPSAEQEEGAPDWADPYRQPLLPDLLAVALERGRLRRAPLVARLERETEGLHQALSEQTASEAVRLRAANLSAMAEFAAGAGHEINNPLAVISGQAQYLLRHEEWLTDEGRPTAKMALQNVIAQTKRIHNVLRELMQFSRPMAPRPTWFELPALLGETAASLAEVANGKRVSVEVIAPERFAAYADAEQVRMALTALLRNAIEAAAGGWARLTLHVREAIEVWVEDSGPGPKAEQRPHLFDPFYSGRSAGRGKGLGLPVAWRLARQQGGDVLLPPAGDGQPTRFVLTLPLASAQREAA